MNVYAKMLGQTSYKILCRFWVELHKKQKETSGSFGKHALLKKLQWSKETPLRNTE